MPIFVSEITQIGFNSFKSELIKTPHVTLFLLFFLLMKHSLMHSYKMNIFSRKMLYVYHQME